ncbi:MAG: hypothetical protein NT024_00995 [Proteobacteria bacterium]|nr:hypothetical protein [Pseudomonadota bacterium]
MSIVLRSRVFSDVAGAAGLGRESLHRTLATGRDARIPADRIPIVASFNTRIS